MWFEIIPSAAIIMGAFTAAPIVIWCTHRLILGNGYRRDLRWWYDRRTYLRDRKLTNNPYRINTLSAIPDEEEKTGKRQGPDKKLRKKCEK